MKSLVNSQNAEDESFEVQLKMLKLSTCLQIILVSRAGELDRACTRACAASLAAETHGGELLSEPAAAGPGLGAGPARRPRGRPRRAAPLLIALASK